MPLYRALPEDFEVTELPAYTPCGEGEHTFLWVEKRLQTTESVARALARQAGVASRDVGYAGRKDRYAVARQWFSVPAAADAVRGLELEGVRVLEVARHRNKLRTGHLLGNRFSVRVREVAAPSVPVLDARLKRFAHRGFLNRYGDQRFGRWRDNAEQGAALLAGRRRVPDRRNGRFLVSATQSAVFHRILELRALAGGEGEDDALGIRLWPGDVAVVVESGGPFLVDDVSIEQARADSFEIAASGLIFGRRVLRAEGLPGEWERQALVEWGLDPLPPAPRGIELRGARRVLRILPRELDWSFAENAEEGPTPARGSEDGSGSPLGAAEGASQAPVDLQLHFTLPSGAFATVLLETLFADCGLRDASRSASSDGPEGGAAPALADDGR